MSIQCPGCKAYLAISNPVACPRCSTLLPQAGSPSGQTADHHKEPASHGNGMLVMTVCFVIVAALALIVYRVVVPSDQQLYERKVGRALASCQQRIAALAKYGNAETPPFVQNHGRDGEFYFAWPSGSFHFTNGFGASMKMSASCTGDVSTGEIKHLTLNGEDVL